jgi:hypothetical protein
MNFTNIYIFDKYTKANLRREIILHCPYKENCRKKKENNCIPFFKPAIIQFRAKFSSYIIFDGGGVGGEVVDEVGGEAGIGGEGDSCVGEDSSGVVE